MDRLAGKVAIVTGAGQGIGRGIARRFAAERANVMVAEIDEETGQRTAAELADGFGVDVLFLRTDVSDRAAVENMVDVTRQRFGSVDILVNNAWGGGSFSGLEKKSDADMERGWRVGCMSAFWSMRKVFPLMCEQGGGRIINICSLNGVNAHMFTAEYNTAKEALRTLTRTAAREWAGHNILANVICPAAATPAYEAFARSSPENAAELLKQNPMGRMGDPELDIGGVALFLASDDARYVTGNTLFVDGGSHINGVAWAPVPPG
ncbi:short-chain dehydrogenase [Longimycelium tulufanense]|uniref:Short-chain dehydrogenase n=1 Tax=Longimycelium tulufanense TaxID=907463 RepID=A0A8J3FUD5_9PSEU|nr:SDR family oxidoreductase [Longimycelium tulufanense]GGM49756.1 short-chain dehydrogenase [Longimycelium tulufanense]